MCNQIENCNKVGITTVAAITHFYIESEEELNFVIGECAKLSVKAVVSKGFDLGGSGTVDLANAVVEAIERDVNHFKKLYDWNLSVEEKIKIIATEIYGADHVEYSNTARQQLKTIVALNLDKLPICMAKTQKSLSDNESKIGRPRDFVINVREFEFAAGAGFVIPILGEMMRMPGLPAIPASEKMDIDINGRISGLS